MLVPYSESDDAEGSGSPLEAASEVSLASRPKVNRELFREPLEEVCPHCGLEQSFYAFNPACDLCFRALFDAGCPDIMYFKLSTKLV